MRVSKLAGLLLVAPLLSLAACDEDETAPEPERFTVTLNAAQEVPTPTGNVASATGTATFTVNTGAATTISFTLTASGLSSAVTGSHIHAPAAAGATAGVVVNLLGAAGVPTTALPGTVSGTIAQSNLSGAINTMDALLNALRTKTAYVNVHTTTNPAGEIRGNF